jgi:hypothetical protein
MNIVSNNQIHELVEKDFSFILFYLSLS